jgi:hypothetical protein
MMFVSPDEKTWIDVYASFEARAPRSHLRMRTLVFFAGGIGMTTFMEDNPLPHPEVLDRESDRASKDAPAHIQPASKPHG